MVYLFFGQDPLSKDAKLQAIKQEFLTKRIEQFNFDLLYSKELTLKDLQEKLLCLPVKSPKRIVVVKDAQNLKQDIKEFILNYAQKPYKQVILVLDITARLKPDEFINRINRLAKAFYFRETKSADTFDLGRSINLKRPDVSLRLLNQLLKEGERPERILGGLRYSLEKDALTLPEMKRRIKLLLDCDIDIKTGRLKALFALEKLVINLCGFSKSFR
jgi:DNA polymerase III delta subunit